MGDTLLTVLEAGAPDRIAVRTPEGDASLSAEQLVEESSRLAGVLAGAGLARGDRVSLVLPNGPEFVQLLFAVTLLGATASPLNPGYTRDEYAFYLDDLAPRALVVSAGEAKAAREAAPEGTLIVDAESSGGNVRLSRAGSQLGEHAAFEAAEADDIALLLHTSGTTSRPNRSPCSTGTSSLRRARSPRTTSSRPKTCRSASCRCSTSTVSWLRCSRSSPPGAASWCRDASPADRSGARSSRTA